MRLTPTQIRAAAKVTITNSKSHYRRISALAFAAVAGAALGVVMGVEPTDGEEARPSPDTTTERALDVTSWLASQQRRPSSRYTQHLRMPSVITLGPTSALTVVCRLFRLSCRLNSPGKEVMTGKQRPRSFQP